MAGAGFDYLILLPRAAFLFDRAEYARINRAASLGIVLVAVIFTNTETKMRSNSKRIGVIALIAAASALSGCTGGTAMDSNAVVMDAPPVSAAVIAEATPDEVAELELRQSKQQAFCADRATKAAVVSITGTVVDLFFPPVIASVPVELAKGGASAALKNETTSELNAKCAEVLADDPVPIDDNGNDKE